MRFEDTGLTKNTLVEDAFNYAQEYNRSLAPEVALQLKQRLEQDYEKRLAGLDQAKEAGQVDEEAYKKYKASLDASMDMQVKRLPLIAKQQLELMFNKAKIAPVLELQQHSENTSPALLAAALVLDTVRDPVDHQKLDAKFGSTVSGLVAEVLHVESYPGTIDQGLSNASADAKRIFLAGLSSSLDQVVQQISKLPPGATLQFPPKQEETMFNQAKTLWGNDKKLDARLVSVFNKAATALASPYRIEVAANGTPTLTETAVVQPQQPGRKKGPKITGDDSP